MSASIPSTAKAMVFEEVNGPLVLKDVPVKQPGPGQILIKSLACGVCHSDVAVQAGAMGNAFPIIPGHEVVGDVVAVGPGAESRWKVGDRAGGGWHGGHDATCKQCYRGMFQCCDNEQINGVTRDGGYQEYVVLQSEAAVDVPKDIDPADAAPLLCAGVTLFNGIRKMGITPGDVVAIQGLGGLGHLGVQYARKMGYRSVALSTSENKKDFALKLGANDFVAGSSEEQAEALQKMGGAALIVVTAPNPKIISPLQNGIAPGGKLLILAPVGEVPVNSVTMILKAQSVHGWPSGHQLDSAEAVRFAQHHDVNCMIEKWPLDKANEALKHMTEGKVRFRSVLLF